MDLRDRDLNFGRNYKCRCMQKRYWEDLHERIWDDNILLHLVKE